MPGDTMDEALEFLSDRGPIFRDVLTNHGPMAAEALIQMGRDDAVLPYLESYRRLLEDRPALNGRVDASNWRAMLGRHEAFAAWQRFFESELGEAPWREVVETWASRLAPGVWAELLHGLIRTAHASRSLASKETPLRLRELAEGLALWASWYEELPYKPGVSKGLAPHEAFARLPLLPREQRGVRAPMNDPESVDSFAEAATLLDVTQPLTALSGITKTFARLYVTNAGLPGNDAIILIHAVTGPSAIRLLEPYVSLATQQRLLRYVWQAAAKINASWNFAEGLSDVEERELDRNDVIDQAVETGDEHAMKLVEACLREHAINPHPAYLAAAADVVSRLKA